MTNLAGGWCCCSKWTLYWQKKKMVPIFSKFHADKTLGACVTRMCKVDASHSISAGIVRENFVTAWPHSLHFRHSARSSKDKIKKLMLNSFIRLLNTAALRTSKYSPMLIFRFMASYAILNKLLKWPTGEAFFFRRLAVLALSICFIQRDKQPK